MGYFDQISKRIRLGSGEETIYEHPCVNRLLVAFMILFWIIFAAAMLVSFVKSSELLYKFFIALAIFFVMLALYRDVVGFIRQGLIVTNKSLITFNGKRVALENVWFFGVKLKAAKKPSLYFYDGNKLIINCHADGSPEFDEFLSALYKISDNKQILSLGSRKINPERFRAMQAKVKLINS